MASPEVRPRILRTAFIFETACTLLQPLQGTEVLVDSGAMSTAKLDVRLKIILLT